MSNLKPDKTLGGHALSVDLLPVFWCRVSASHHSVGTGELARVEVCELWCRDFLFGPRLLLLLPDSPLCCD
jgi:hypothetical protein